MGECFLFEQIRNKISGLSVEERRKVYEATFVFLAETPLVYQDLNGIAQRVSARDDMKICLSAENGDCFYFQRTTQEAEYNRFIQEFLQDETISVRLEIDKNIQDQHLSVYCFEEFKKDILSSPVEELLKDFSLLLKESGGYLVFDLFDSENIFCTKTMFFKPAGNNDINIEFDRNRRLQDCREISYFYNQESFELLPDDFKIMIGYKENPLAELFSRLETILSLCMLASNSSLQQGKLKLQIMGQRSVEYTYELDKIDGAPVFYKLYDWIYSGGSTIDKAAIARNMICLHCKYEPLLRLDAKILAAVQSSYNLYLKENVAQYLELKNKVAEFISEIVSRTGEYATDLLDKFKTNLLAIFGFLFTVIIANIVSDQPLDNIFTRDITAILELVLAGSAVYLFISYKQSRYQMKKVYDSYEKLKRSYHAILTEDDIRECFQDDRIMLDMKKTIHKSQKTYLIIWIGFLCILWICLECMSDAPIIFPWLERLVKWTGR